MKRSEDFIKLCNQLNTILVRKYKLQPHATLGQAIRYSKDDIVIKRFYDVLIDYTELRNVLVHSKLSYDYLAEPSEHVIHTLRHVITHIESPKRVKDYFQSDVETLNIEMTLRDVMKIIQVKRFSHFPVYDNQRCVGILTDNGIVHYLSDHLVDASQYQHITVKDLIQSDDHSLDFAFITLNMTAIEVFETFDRKKDVRVLLILDQMEDQTRKRLKGMVLKKDLYQVVVDMLDMKAL
jgi:predicted transcriptional regulator